MNNKKRLVAVVASAAMSVTMLMPQTAIAAKKKPAYVTRSYALQQIEKRLGATVASAGAISAVRDVSKNDPSYRVMSVALNAGLVSPDKAGKLKPAAKATNSYVAGVLAKVEEKSKAAVLKNRKSGARLTKTALSTYVNKQLKNVVKKSGTTISGKTYKGDLIVGDGVGKGEVYLDDVTVGGRLIVRGGGVNSVYIRGTSSISQITIRQVNNDVSIKVVGDAHIGMVYVEDHSNDVYVEGAVGSLTINGADIAVTFKGASAEKVTVSDKARNSRLIADKDSTIQEVSLNAKGSEASGDGKIGTVAVNADDTTVSITDKSTKVEVKEGVSAPKKNEDTAGQTENTSSGNTSGTDTQANTETTTTNPTGGTTETTGTGTSETGTTGTTGGGASGTGTTGTTGSSTSGATGGGTTETTGGLAGGDTGSTGGDSEGTDPSDDKEIKYNTDHRFATGYPKIATQKNVETGSTITITYKLADDVAVSEASPAKVSYVIGIANGGSDAATDAVLSGHLGTKESPIYADHYGEIEISDHEEHSITYIYPHNSVYGMTVYSVIEAGGVISETPTRIHYDADTAEGMITGDFRPDSIAYINSDLSKITVFYEHRLDESSVPASSCFSVKKDSETVAAVKNVAIKNVAIKNVAIHGSYRYMSNIELTLDKALAKFDDTYSISYTAPAESPLQDRSENKAKDFDIHVEQASTQITSVTQSSDYQYFTVIIPVTDMSYHKVGNGIQCYVNGSQTPVEQVYSLYSYNTTWLYYRLATPEKITSIRICPDGDALYNPAGERFNETSTQNITLDKEFGFGDAKYDGNQITVSLTDLSDGEGSYDSFDASLFTMTVDGKAYKLKGDAQLQGNKIQLDQDSIKHIDLSTATNITLQYDPGDPSVETLYNSYKYLFYKSGKPVPKSGIIHVNKK